MWSLHLYWTCYTDAVYSHHRKRDSKEGKDLFRKSIIRYQIYPAIYSQLDCFKVPKLGSKPQKKLTAPLKAKSLELQYVSIYKLGLDLLFAKLWLALSWLPDNALFPITASSQATTYYLLDTTIILLRVPDGSTNQADSLIQNFMIINGRTLFFLYCYPWITAKNSENVKFSFWKWIVLIINVHIKLIWFFKAYRNRITDVIIDLNHFTDVSFYLLVKIGPNFFGSALTRWNDFGK